MILKLKIMKINQEKKTFFYNSMNKNYVFKRFLDAEFQYLLSIWSKIIQIHTLFHD